MLSDTKSVQSDVAERWVEMDQEDKALAITGRPNGLTFSAFIIQEFPQRVQRHDFVEQIVRQCFDFFDGHPERQREIVAAADKAAQAQGYANAAALKLKIEMLSAISCGVQTYGGPTYCNE